MSEHDMHVINIAHCFLQRDAFCDNTNICVQQISLNCKLNLKGVF